MGGGTSKEATDGDYLTHTPPRDVKHWTLPDTLVGRKRKMMKDWDAIKRLDQHALNVSI